MAEDLAQYEYAAYHSILKALALSPASWETEEILTSLRMVLHISDEVHSDCRGRVNKDPEIVELREMQKQQRQSMRGGMQQQPSMTMSAGPGNVAPMQTFESGTGGPGAVAGHVMPPLMAQNSVTGANTHFGAPLANAPGPRDTLPLATGKQEPAGTTRSSAARPSGGANAWTQPPLSARQPSARTLTAPEASTTAGGSAKHVKSPVGQKKTLTVSKTSKANARFAQAVPAGVDIMTDDLRGYVLERRNAEGVAWEQCVVVGCRKESTGQRLTVATGFGSAIERYTADVFLRKGKAGILWRFAMPVQRRKGDWDAALARAAAAASAGGVAASIGAGAAHAPSGSARGGGGGCGAVAGLVGLGGSITGDMTPSGSSLPVAVPAKAPSKKRKADVASVSEVPPFTADVRKQAIAAAQATQNPTELHAMVSSIQDKRKTLVEQLANLRVQDMLANASHKDALAKLRSELDSVRTKQAALKSDPGTNGKALAARGTAVDPPASPTAAADRAAADGAAAAGSAAVAAVASSTAVAAAAAATAVGGAATATAHPAPATHEPEPKTLSASEATDVAPAAAPAAAAAPDAPAAPAVDTTASSPPKAASTGAAAAAAAEQHSTQNAPNSVAGAPEDAAAKPSSNADAAMQPAQQQLQGRQSFAAPAEATGAGQAAGAAAATATAPAAIASGGQQSPGSALPQTSGAGSDKAEDTTATAQPPETNACAAPAADAAPARDAADARAQAAGSPAAAGPVDPADPKAASEDTETGTAARNPVDSSDQQAPTATPAEPEFAAEPKADEDAEMHTVEAVEASGAAESETEKRTQPTMSPTPRSSPPPCAHTVATAAAKHVEPSPDEVHDTEMHDVSAAAPAEEIKPPEDLNPENLNAGHAPMQGAEAGHVDGSKPEPLSTAPTADQIQHADDPAPQCDVEMQDVSEVQRDSSAKQDAETVSHAVSSKADDSSQAAAVEGEETDGPGELQPTKSQPDAPDQTAAAEQQKEARDEPHSEPHSEPPSAPTTDAATENAATQPPSEPRTGGAPAAATAEPGKETPVDTKVAAPPQPAVAVEPAMSPVTAENETAEVHEKAAEQSAVESDVAAVEAPPKGAEKPPSTEGNDEEMIGEGKKAAEEDGDKSTKVEAKEAGAQNL